MKKIIFIVLMVLFAVPFMAIAGQSDKALQTMILNGSELLGFTKDENIEDTKNAAECNNLYQSGSGLSTLYYSYHSFVTGETFINAKMVNDEIIYSCSGTLLGSRTILHRSGQEIIPSAYSGSNFLFAFGFYKSGPYYYAMNSSVMFKALYGSTVPTQITGLPFYVGTYLATSAAIWKNRLWVSSCDSASPYLQNRLFVSKPTDWEDFTTGTAPGDGFVQDIPDYSKVVKLVSNLTGLYIICTNAIYLISGGDSPDTWRCEKVALFNQTASGINQIIPYKNAIILNDGKDFYILEGYELQKFCSFPYDGFALISCAMWYDRFFVMQSSSNVNSVIYDVQSKSYFSFEKISGLIENNYFVKNGWIQNLPNFKQNNLNQITPFTYKTCWLTLDGNASNFKEIVRIEVDSLLNAAGSVEIGLGCSTKTGEEYINKIVGGKTYIEAVEGSRPPTNTYVWNIGMRKAVRRIYFKWAYSAGTIGATSFLKQVRIFYRNVGNTKSNEVR